MYYLDTEKLAGEYREVFLKVEAYAFMCGMSEEEQEDLLENLVDMLYSAQTDGKSVEKIIGKDIEKFCKQYFEGYSRFGKLFHDIPKVAYRLVCFMIFCILLECMYPKEIGFVEMLKSSTDASGVMAGLLASILSMFFAKLLLKPILFRFKKLNALAVMSVQFVISIGLIFVILRFYGDILFAVPTYFVLLSCVVYIVIYKAVVLNKRYTKTGSVKKSNSNSFKQMVSAVCDEGMKDLPKELKNRFHKKNETLRKRGKEIITPDEYMKQLLKENADTKRTNQFSLALCFVLFVCASIW